MALWVEKKWKHMIKGNISHTLCRHGYFVFLIEEKEENPNLLKWPILHGLKRHVS
jgi:hypothetical protein